MSVKTKTLRRAEWQRVMARRFAWKTLNGPVRGVAALLAIDAVKAPLAVQSVGRRVTIVDAGYQWLQIAPEGRAWWLTVMFDPEGQITQYYFDVTLFNRISGADSTFDDLFLDVVVNPDGERELLDADELDGALAAGEITPAQHAAAWETARALLAAFPARIGELRSACERLRAELVEAL